MDHTQSLYFFLFNTIWMGWNVLLAVVPIVLAGLLQKEKSHIKQIPLFLLWLVFLPNTLYMITDIIHVFNPRFTQMTLPFWILGVVLYIFVFCLAVFTFVLSIKPMLQKYHVFLNTLSVTQKLVLFSFFSLLIGFAISMGRFQRTNTWYIFTQPIRVMRDVVDSLTDPVVLLVAIFYSVGAMTILAITNRNLRDNSKDRLQTSET